MNRTIITVVGKDTVGIIAKVCTYMADHQINILDISQTIIQGFFNMMMSVRGKIFLTRCIGSKGHDQYTRGHRDQ